MIEITVNDMPHQLSAGTTIAELLVDLKIVSPAVAVEVNQQIQPRNRYSTVRLQPGDELEIVTLAGGG